MWENQENCTILYRLSESRETFCCERPPSFNDPVCFPNSWPLLLRRNCRGVFCLFVCVCVQLVVFQDRSRCGKDQKSKPLVLLGYLLFPKDQEKEDQGCTRKLQSTQNTMKKTGKTLNESKETAPNGAKRVSAREQC